MRRARFETYLSGGRPSGAARTYAGCRDPRPPADSRLMHLPGALYFATESDVWTGGRAFYDPDAPGSVPARAYLITGGQFFDVVAQEMDREPGTGPAMDPTALAALPPGGRLRLGGGRYETLVHAGDVDGVPVLTFTAPWSMGDVAANPPSAAYLAHLAGGLAEAGAGDARAVARYLAGCPGAAGYWDEEEIARLV
nr:histone deacetylase [Streptomyces sp. NRRL F-5126]